MILIVEPMTIPAAIEAAGKLKPAFELRESTSRPPAHFCAWCSNWFDVEWRPVVSSAVPQTHGVCPRCRENFLAGAHRDHAQVSPAAMLGNARAVTQAPAADVSEVVG